MQEFSNSFARPFNVRYNPYTQVTLHTHTGHTRTPTLRSHPKKTLIILIT
jgi:hypothetical protein